AITDLAAIGYEAEQAFQRFRSLRDTETELAIKGFGTGAEATGPAVPNVAAGEFDNLKSQTNEYAGTVKNLQEELNKLPVSAQSSRAGFAELATGLAGLRHIEPEKALEPFVKAANQSPEALAKLVSATFGLEGQLTSTGESLSEVVKRTTNADEAFQTIVKAVTDARRSILDAGDAGRKSGNDLTELAVAAAAGAEYTGGMGVAMDAFAQAATKSIDPLKNAANASDQLTGAIRAQNEAISLGNASLDKRTELVQRLADAQAGAANVNGTSTEGEYGGESGARVRRARDAARNLQVEVQTAPLPPAEEEAHRVRLENIRAEAEARKADLSAQATAADRRVEEARREMAARITTGRTEANLPGIPEDQLAIQVEATAQVKAAEDEAKEAHRR